MKNRVINDVLQHTGKGVHPRIFLTASDFEMLRESNDPVFVAAKRMTISEADQYMEMPLLKYEIPDGIRLLDVSRAMMARTMYLGMAYKLTGDSKYARRLYDELENVASFKDWNPYHFLDVGEMSCAFGIGYDWVYECMSEDERKKIRAAIKEKALEPAMDDYLDRERKRSYRWYQDMPGDNWKLVCNGGITVASLAICDEDDVDREWLSDIFGYAFDNSYRAIRDFYLPDGSYAEGFTYWNYATDFLAHYVSALKCAAGTDYGLADYEPIETSAYYVKMMCSNTFMSFNFGDAWEDLLCEEVFSRIGKNYNNAEITTMRGDIVTKDPSLARVRDLIWRTPMERKLLDGRALGCGSVGGANASFRSGFDEDDFYTAIHFGDNNAYHGHADMGTFVAEWKKRRFLSDLGQDNYNVKGNYHNTYRYRAEGHNTLVINPSAGPDQELNSFCLIDRFNDGTEGEAYAVCDISAAYFGKKVVRGMRMTADKKWSIVRDEFTLDEGDVGYWFAHTKADIELVNGGKGAVLTMDGESLYLAILGEGVFENRAAEVMCKEIYLPDQYDNSAYRKLAVKFDKSGSLAVAIAPMYDGKIPTELPENNKIADWS